jgi:fermentation-respiration switch protein FrsA (DUF1100 family)
MRTINKSLQAAAAIAKTTQTLIGSEIDTEGAASITLFFAYTKGDETGLLIKPYFLTSVGGTKAQVRDWLGSSGAYTSSAVSITKTATETFSVTLDVSGVTGVRIEAAGSNNDGTPTGTLAAWYTLK